MPGLDFSSARAKLRRARQHRTDLETYVEETFNDPETWALMSAELDPSTGLHIFRISYVPEYGPVLEDIALQVGDIAHNLRSALDHMFWQLALDHGPVANKDVPSVVFPIKDSATGRGSFGSSPAKGFVDASDWAFLEQFQPYFKIQGLPDGYSGPYVHQAGQLKDLSNLDKHQELPTVVLTSGHFQTIALSGEPLMGYHSVDEYLETFRRSSHMIALDEEVVRLKVAPTYANRDKIENAGAVYPRVALDELRPIVPTLDRIADFVVLILEKLEGHLGDSGRLPPQHAARDRP